MIGEKLKLLVPPPVLALISGLAMWGITSVLPAAILSFPVQRVAAIALIGLGVVIDLISILAFRRAKTTVTPLAPEKASSLVVTGLYKFTRNPMYLGLLLILSGIALWLGSLTNIAVLLAFMAYITVFQIKPEEDRLQEIFGDAYKSYKREVRRWI